MRVVQAAQSAVFLFRRPKPTHPIVDKHTQQRVESLQDSSGISPNSENQGVRDVIFPFSVISATTNKLP